MGIIADNISLVEELSRYCRLCYDRRLVGATGGNLSARVPGKNFFLVTASGVALRDVCPGNIVVVDAAGDFVEGPEGLMASKEISFHLAIYSVKPQVNVIVHVHPTFTTIYASARKEIPLITVSSRIKVKQGLIVPEHNPGSKELCDEVIKAVRESPNETTVILLEAHGLVAYGTTLSEAFNDAELLEDTAKIAFYRSLLK